MSPGSAQNPPHPPDAGARHEAHSLLDAFAQELVRCGMRTAATAPGSRNTPLLLALCGQAELHCVSHIDERSAGFFALGVAKASGLPAAVTCTSGTAAAELYPAVIEAHEASVPLLVLSADRPAELRECGAGQAIDQIKLYGDAVKWFFEVELPPGLAADAKGRAEAFIRTLACRAYWRCLEGRPGPVHLNFPLREPLIPTAQIEPAAGGRAGGAPYLRRSAAAPQNPEAVRELAALLERSQRPLLVAGRREGTPAERERYAVALSTFAHRHSIPLLADPLAGARRGEAAIARYDAILRGERLARSLAPDLVVRVGALPTSKPLRSWLAGLTEATQVALDPLGDLQDPDGVLCLSLALDPALALDELEPLRPGNTQEWLGRWRAADERAAQALLPLLAREGLSELQVAAELGALLPAEATLVVSSSMPVRDIETFFPARADPPSVLCNRGANGIDGVIATASGVCFESEHAGTRGPVIALIGDVALAHDVGSLLALARLQLPLVIVLINNGGGAIFDFLPVGRAASARAIYERQVATPPGLDCGPLATLAGLAYEQAGDRASLRAALQEAIDAGTGTLIEVAGDRAENVRRHEEAFAAVAKALSDL
ncbi:MAG TPA: 2-succinyl-5-enolpyruvyl-6-hydroxy-3-cyclohexene-1-carboxylic-acid synthase [Solirubrobacteraceae bacterium]|nr:2-succinyl-5-enolpyruvyl-6-hydroxy-3-cyclohexene-1-carboxylic-acid synthase [Solirubrobacteraceae bacterium]